MQSSKNTILKLITVSFAFFLTLSNFASAQSTNNKNYFSFGTATNPKGETLFVDSRGFVLNGKHILPVMGEIHYARVPQHDWKREILKMKAGGVTVIATYIFWIHHNDKEGIWNWNDNLNLRQFVKTCQECGMPVVLRVGPFCHGEAYLGGIPLWVVERSKNQHFKMRSADAPWLALTRDLYTQIFQQVKGLLWKDGGPIIGVQLENECRGPWPYMQALKDMAIEIGYDVPFFTRTGWPRFNGKPKFGEILPLYGDYADGFWDRELTDMPGEYKQAFEMREAKVAATIATEQFSKDELTTDESTTSTLSYPYFTCELGGGMMTSYHRRIHIFDRDALALAVCKVGSGSNLPGYYMYHGGTNPDNPDHNMAEMQQSPFTNYNDVPHKSYDFQCPLAEVGQVNESYHLTRIFHQFLADWGPQLAETQTQLFNKHLAYRLLTKESGLLLFEGPSSPYFKFYNDYVRIINPTSTTYWQMYGIDGIDSVSAMPFCKTDDAIYYIRIPGIKPVVYGNHSGKKVKILTYEQARQLFKIDGKLYKSRHGGILFKDTDGTIVEEWWKTIDSDVKFQVLPTSNVQLREVKMGPAKAAEQPSDSAFSHAAIYTLEGLTSTVQRLTSNTSDLLPFEGRSGEVSFFLRISYSGDVARVYADGKLVADNFWNGKPFYVRVSDLVGKKVEIKILPMGKDYPLYLQQQQRETLNSTSGEYMLSLDNISLIHRLTK